MQSSVLGKRSQSYSDFPSCVQDIPTPESTPNPKRLKTAFTLGDIHSDCNKENVPPLTSSPPPTPLRRASTSVISVNERRTLRRHSSDSHPLTPATSLAHLSIATPPPTPPNSLTPIYTRARALLRSTSNGTSSISGRSAERATITQFIRSFVDGDPDSTSESSSLYISGSPGTGKTALVNAILNKVDPALLTVININCMALSDIESLWERLIDELTPKQCKASGKPKGLAGVNKLLATAPKRVLVLDELDHITTCAQSLKSLFLLSQTNFSRLRIIGIANTHTLTSSPFQSNHNGTTSVTTLHFSPYSSEQLLEILLLRLDPLYSDRTLEKAAKQLLPTPALTLLTKKISSQTGDVRALFEVLRGAIDISVADSQSKPDPINSCVLVSPKNILSALKAHTSSSHSRSGIASTSEVVTKVRNVGLHARFLLLSLSLACRRLESKLPIISSHAPSVRPPQKRTASTPHIKATVDTAQLHRYYTNLLVKNSDAFTPVSRSEFDDIINMLETLGLVAPPTTPSKHFRKTFSRSSSFAGSSLKSAASATITFVEGVRMEEILRGLGVEQPTVPGASLDVKEEELRAIWEKETREIRREILANLRSKNAVAGGFEDMAED